MHVKLSVVALSVATAFALTACGQKEEPKAVAPAAPAAKPASVAEEAADRGAPVSALRPAPPPRAQQEPETPGPISVFMDKVRDWLFGGNTIVRAGIVILFLGLVFLVRFAAVAGLFPIEARLSLVAAVGVALLAIGLRKRIERPLTERRGR